MNNFAAIILAAGEGKRMKSNISKVMHRILDKPLIGYAVDECKNAEANDICLVVGHKKEQIMDYFSDGVKYAFQNEQLGTGHAVMQAMDFIKRFDAILVTYGDTPLITAKNIKGIYDKHIKDGNGVTLVTTIMEDPTGYGRVVKDLNGNVLRIVEQKDCNEEELKIKESNMGMYVFSRDALIFALNNLTNNNSQKEYYITDTIELILKSGQNAGTYIIDDIRETLGINDRYQLSVAAKIIKERININHMLNGVTIVDPDNTYIHPDVEIGMDTIIHPGCHIKTGSIIGENCEIGPDTIIKNSIVGNNTVVLKSVVNDSKIGDKTTVGPFAYIRPDSEIGSNVKIGDFVEIKKSSIGDGSKVSHLTYIGDAIVGKDVNFGCGTVTVNYDGKHKYKTIINDKAFIGCNTNLIAPVEVEENAYIAAGSTINETVPKDSLAIARARQIIKEDWRLKREDLHK